MIYDEPRFLPAGDRYLLVEFGNTMLLDLNFLAQGLAKKLEEAPVKGVIETAPCFASMLVHYDPESVSFEYLVAALREVAGSLGSPSNITVPSRLFYLPAMYFDPWTEECVADYCKRIGPKENDPEVVIRANGLSNREELLRVHSGTEYWVASLGFWPGLPFLRALDPRSTLSAPKYNPPRTNTPAGAIGLGGGANSIYPVATPGGYQIFARTPVPIWDPKQRFDVFEHSICLFRPGDRIKFVPCSRQEFEDVERRVEDGSYVFNVAEYGQFSVSQYNVWVASINAKARF
ncbi:5-oxoprolinase subunit B family protein [Paraburkholderia nemoris]|uniref:5-oxoprolinase subunit B n=1 Tax=Paraburkholderia nemoris TaxID=2793076 RepID=A0ABN7MZ63_9BURK|nr:carboxyltransferase domain-containing protein [Paraburkholderia nemoris]MBK3815213.1 carboxyltransferase domain-containing protein [Paraburkholderia aspalathi]CAE6713858.1 5-oxoprolinase subunit B [Paraburkholderia nemoris]CAE6839659.1 5-oxoprolinase subunit B [Paraburkholderia nemoris]